ncbi:MAG: hypothetical protein ACLFS9_02360 [Nitriliruptoraceae bacterium]
MSDLRLDLGGAAVTDIEVAAITVAVAALTGAGDAPGGPGADGRDRPGAGPAWRTAGLLEATGGRRLGSRAALTRATRA